MSSRGELLTFAVLLCALNPVFLNESYSMPGKEPKSNSLAFKLHRLLSSYSSNTLFSPISIFISLAMVYLGARDHTAEELEAVLGFDGVKSHKEVQAFMNVLKTNSEDYSLDVANAALFQSSYPILPEYKSELNRFYKALVKEVNFKGDTKGAIELINNWIQKHTRNQIHEILSTKPDNSTLVLLLNAVYFRGTWQKTFQSRFTRQGDFHNDGISVSPISQVPMMKIKEKLLFYNSDEKKFCIFQLPYKGKEVSMIILLPEEMDALGSVEEHLTDGILQKTLKQMTKIDLEVFLPKFQLENFLELKDVLKSLGLKEAFSEGANLGGISHKQGLFVSQILHKTAIEVAETGTKASSVTEVDATDRSMVFVDRVVRVDHPFMFFIIHNPSHIILFMGSVKSL